MRGQALGKERIGERKIPGDGENEQTRGGSDYQNFRSKDILYLILSTFLCYIVL